MLLSLWICAGLPVAPVALIGPKSNTHKYVHVALFGHPWPQRFEEQIPCNIYDALTPSLDALTS